MREVWASYVRNRWPKNTLGSIMQEFDLTEGEARNLLYSHGSQNTFDKCGAHKNGGPLLELDLLMHRWQTSLTEIAQEKERKHAHERERQEARIQSERLALSRLASCEIQAGASAASLTQPAVLARHPMWSAPAASVVQPVGEARS